MAAQMIASLLGELVFLPALLSLRPNRRAVAPVAAPATEETEPEIVSMTVLRPHFQAKPRTKAAHH